MSASPEYSGPVLTSLTGGRIAYLDADGSSVGEERFELLRHRGGAALRAVCELEDVGLLRDVNIAFDAAMRPVDGWCRLSRGGSIIGRNWFLLDGGAAEVLSELPGRERVVQHFDADPPVDYLGLHPLQGDALAVSGAELAAPGSSGIVHGLTNSISESGDEGLTAERVAIAVTFIGADEVATAAGTFAANCYELQWKRDWPPARLWVRSSDLLFLKLTWEQVETRYELVEYHERR